MKLKSISALRFEVSDLAKTAQFYEDLGFYLEKREDDYVMVRINWFWVEFYQGKPAPGPGQSVLVSVEDVNELKKALDAKGIKSGEVTKNTERGRSELHLADPDGYQLVFFQK